MSLLHNGRLFIINLWGYYNILILIIISVIVLLYYCINNCQLIYVNFFLEQHFNDVYDSEALEQKMDADLQVWEDTWNHNMNVKLQQVSMG